MRRLVREGKQDHVLARLGVGKRDAAWRACGSSISVAAHAALDEFGVAQSQSRGSNWPGRQAADAKRHGTVSVLDFCAQFGAPASSVFDPFLADIRARIEQAPGLHERGACSERVHAQAPGFCDLRSGGDHFDGPVGAGL